MDAAVILKLLFFKVISRINIVSISNGIVIKCSTVTYDAQSVQYVKITCLFKYIDFDT